MTEPFNTDFFRNNRISLLHTLGQDAPVVITANGLIQSSADNTFPFHQDPNFWYLTGIDQPDYILVIDRDDTYLIAPSRTDVQELFDGSTSSSSLQERSGINLVLEPSEGKKRLAASLQRNSRVHTLSANPSYISLYGMFTSPARARLIQRMKRIVPGIEVLDIRKQLAELRVVKQPQEISAIRQAVDTTTHTLTTVMQQTYAYEYEIEADISHGFRWSGASGHSFSPIVASGKNACVLHYLANNDTLQAGQLILSDVGATASHYASDIARTWSQEKPTDRQKAVYAAVDEAVNFGISQLKPGPSFYDSEQKVREFIGKKLKDLKLIKYIDKEGIFKYYPHAPHYLGLDVHDVGNTRQPMKPGMVMTIEPGIYIPEEGIGIRLEEDLLITENGCEILSKACPRTLTSVQ